MDKISSDSPSRDPLGKLLPKTLSEKRRRRKEKKAAELARDSSSSLTTGDDDKRGRSLSPATSGRDASLMGSDDADGSNSTKSDQRGESASAGPQSLHSYNSREQLEEDGIAASAATRPPPVSVHPSLIGYLTTSSPVVQAEHLDSQQSDLDSVSHILTNATTNQDIPSPDVPPKSEIPSQPPAAKIAAPKRRSKPSVEIDTSDPTTPPAKEHAARAPAIVNTPPTPVEVQTAKFPSSDWKAPWRGSGQADSPDGSAPARNMSTHRRARTSSVTIGPSKLSTITTAPQSPPIEGNQPAPSANSNVPPSGFFSSMFSAAQSAANNISTNIQNSGINLAPNKRRNSTSGPAQPGPSPNQPSAESTTEESASKPEPAVMEKKDSSFRSIGSGDLSLSHLGIAEPTSAADTASPSNSRFPELSDQRARSESAPVDSQAASSVDLTTEGTQSRPRSLHEAGAQVTADQSPHSGDFVESKLNLHRGSSLRSASKTHRKRGSSVATTGTGMTIGAAIAAANTSLANPAAAPKLTGFAIASKKRNRDFHTIFKSVPDDDYLIEDYSCALQREILAHGRLYVSEGHLCFSSNILGWTTTLVMSFDEIVSVEKRSTALVFKNGLMISTLHAKHIFASFTGRDATYDLIVNIWKLGHPTLTSTLNGVRLEGTGGDKTEKVDDDGPNTANGSQAGSDSEEDSDDDDDGSYLEDSEDGHDSQLGESAISTGEVEKAVMRKASATAPVAGVVAAVAAKDSPAAPAGDADFPGPATHAPTDCGDVANHYEKIVGDEIIAAPLGKVWNLLFGPASPVFMSKWLTVEQKCTELQMDDKKGLSQDSPSRTYSYIKPLYGAIGPKQTKCIVTETLESLDLEKSANLNVQTQTPDVPSGNVFVIKTRYCLTWADNNSTRLQMNCTVEWSGKSWLKGAIEKGAESGQTQFCKDICTSLRAAVSTKSRPAAVANGVTKTKKKSKRNKTSQSPGRTTESSPAQKRAAKQDWGFLEPVRQILEPVLDILKPLVTGNVMYGLLVGLLVAAWFGFGFPPGRAASSYGQHPQMGMYGVDRLAAYEEMWRREDSELWEWLEERVGVGRLGADAGRPSPASSASRPAVKKKAVEPRTLEEKVREEKMDDRQVEEAIRVTEEKLEILRQAMERTQSGRNPSKQEEALADQS